MNNVSFKAIMIAVGVILTITTITIILIYYNVSIQQAKELNERTDIATTYSNKVSLIFEKDVLTGIDVRNLVRYYYLDEKVEINITKIKAVDKFSDNLYKNINNTWVVPDKNIISEANMTRINPSYNGKIISNEMNGNIRIINIVLS